VGVARARAAEEPVWWVKSSHWWEGNLHAIRAHVGCHFDVSVIPIQYIFSNLLNIWRPRSKIEVLTRFESSSLFFSRKKSAKESMSHNAMFLADACEALRSELVGTENLAGPQRAVLEARVAHLLERVDAVAAADDHRAEVMSLPPPFVMHGVVVSRSRSRARQLAQAPSFVL